MVRKPLGGRDFLRIGLLDHGEAFVEQEALVVLDLGHDLDRELLAYLRPGADIEEGDRGLARAHRIDEFGVVVDHAADLAALGKFFQELPARLDVALVAAALHRERQHQQAGEIDRERHAQLALEARLEQLLDRLDRLVDEVGAIAPERAGSGERHGHQLALGVLLEEDRRNVLERRHLVERDRLDPIFLDHGAEHRVPARDQVVVHAWPRRLDLGDDRHRAAGVQFPGDLVAGLGHIGIDDLARDLDPGRTPHDDEQLLALLRGGEIHRTATVSCRAPRRRRIFSSSRRDNPFIVAVPCIQVIFPGS